MNHSQRSVAIHARPAFGSRLSLLTSNLLIGRLHKAMDLICIDILQIMTVHLHPGIFQNVLSRNPLIRLFLEKFLEEEASWWAYVVRELKLMKFNRVIQLFVIGALEGELAAE